VSLKKDRFGWVEGSTTEFYDSCRLPLKYCCATCALHNRKQRAFYVKALDKMILFFDFSSGWNGTSAGINPIFQRFIFQNGAFGRISSETRSCRRLR
tara:strand:- start:912 stop:1202 length:291 start_codon:yes stop_codon:yes gene_type:complete